MGNKIEHVATKTAMSYARDGYHLSSYDVRDSPPQYIYSMQHDNENKIKIVADEIDDKIYIYLNGKLNKTIDKI